jgi:NADPH:quinone reductase-like Zn-dependent oxidoreductase
VKAGNSEVIQYKEVANPKVPENWVLIEVKAFGLNRSEMFTRQGHSPDVKFPRIQGIECVGVIQQDDSGKFKVGQQVAAIMGGMGRDFDGGYAELVSVPVTNVFAFKSNLPWSVLGAVPEMFQTVSGSLNEALEVKFNEVLLIRGGTSSIGLLACQLAKHYGLQVVSSTRNPDKVGFLKSNGADYVVLDNGTVHDQVRELFPNGVHKVLELIGVTTLKDSLKCIAKKGVVCMTGILGNSWTMNDFTPMGDVPSLGRLTVYMGESGNLDEEKLQDFLIALENKEIEIKIDHVFKLNQVGEAHSLMESNQAKGKLVVEI